MSSEHATFLAALRDYFRGEKRESLVILVASSGLLAVGIGAIAIVGGPFARGLGIVVIATALVGAVVGATIVLRTDRQVASLVDLWNSDRDRFAAEEGPRIGTVVRSFRLYRAVYAGATIAAILLLLLTDAPLAHGVAWGLLIFAGSGFTVDHFAESRAIRYAAQVRAQSALAPDLLTTRRESP
ncbi:MAG: hypothetical protein WD737_10420 [Gemmatimonadota bacterium]